MANAPKFAGKNRAKNGAGGMQTAFCFGAD